MKTPLVLRYFLWSMLIFAVSMFCLSFRTLDSLQYKALALGADLRYGSYWKSIKQADYPYRTLPVWGPQITQEQYFRIAREVVHKLKLAGAKVVIVPVPDFYLPSPQANKTILEIASDSIAVFGVPSAFNSTLPWERELRIENKNAWWVRDPFFNRLRVPWGVMSTDIKNNSPLIRFVPIGFKESETGEPVSDVATIALKRYFGVPDREELPISRSRVLVGPRSIQIGQDGVSYLRFAYVQRRPWEISVRFNFSTDSLEYVFAWDQPRGRMITPEEAWPNHKGAIVVLDWNSARRNQYVYYGGAYQQVFGSVFNGSFVTVHNEWNVLLITTLVVLLSVFSFTFRNSLTVLVSFVLVAGSIFISGWLFVSYDVVFEPVYVVVPIVLCAFTLPLVKMSGQKRIAEEKIRSLEEENRRLLDLQRSAPPQVLP